MRCMQEQNSHDGGKGERVTCRKHAEVKQRLSQKKRRGEKNWGMKNECVSKKTACSCLRKGGKKNSGA